MKLWRIRRKWSIDESEEFNITDKIYMKDLSIRIREFKILKIKDWRMFNEKSKLHILWSLFYLKKLDKIIKVCYNTNYEDV